MHRAIVSLSTVALLLLTGSAAADVGRTPLAAARARTDRAARREAASYGGAATYKLGSCALLHRRPWVAYRCGYTMFGRGLQCHLVLTLGVRRTASGLYNAILLKTLAEGPVDAPC